MQKTDIFDCDDSGSCSHALQELGIDPKRITQDGSNLPLSEVTDQQLIREMLARIGDDPNRPGLLETPYRVVKSWKELFSGYQYSEKDIADIFGKKFESDNDEMVVVGPIRFYSMCEHHMVPIIGNAFVGYIPNKHTIGISKLARIVEAFARRLQIQEQLNSQIVNALNEYIKPKGAGCIITAEHLCMTSRGIKNFASKTRTSGLVGNFKDTIVRSEFLSLVNSSDRLSE